MLILVTGSWGMVGTALCKKLKYYELLTPGKIYLDVRNYEQVMSFAKHEIEFIIHLAAATDHIACEFNPSDAYMTNTIGTFNMVELAKKKNVPILYLSTCGLFDGMMPRYIETDTPNPINHYSRSKFYGEQICKAYEKHFIVRSGWMMGGGPAGDKKFCGKIFKQIQGGAKKIYAVSDVYGSPTLVDDLANELLDVFETKQPGIYHCANFGEPSRFDVACEFVDALGLSAKVEVIALKFDEFYQREKLTCPYTRNEVCMSNKLPPMRYWKEALREYARKEFLPCLPVNS